MTDAVPHVISELLSSIASGRLVIVDLTNRLSATTPTMHLPEPFANLIGFSLEEVSRYDETGPYWHHNNIHAGEHTGTHLDAPIHWITGKDGHDVAGIPPERLIGAANVIDVRAQVEADPDFLLEPHHVLEWEALHGRMAEGSWLLMRTGWDRFSQDREAFLNTTDGVSHTPGVSAECALWLAEQRPISGFGIDTVGIDAGRAGELDPPFPMHHLLLGNDKYGVTSLQNLDLLPETGALLIVAPLPIVGGTGSPTRVLAIVPGVDR
jgi:kynurenine formamidase